MAHNPHSLHPVLHASEHETRETREARQRQLDKLEELRALLGQLSDPPEVERVRREALRVLNSLFEQCKVSYCSCSISHWYYRVSAELGYPLSWEPL